MGFLIGRKLMLPSSSFFTLLKGLSHFVSLFQTCFKSSYFLFIVLIFVCVINVILSMVYEKEVYPDFFCIFCIA